MVLLIIHNELDYSTSTLYWGCIESSLSVLSASLPTMLPIIKKIQHMASRSRPGPKGLALGSGKSKHHGLEREAGSFHSSSGLRGEETRAESMGVSTYIHSMPLQDMQPDDRDAGVWVQREVWNSTGRKAEWSGV